jgi:hypothetical protein
LKEESDKASADKSVAEKEIADKAKAEKEASDKLTAETQLKEEEAKRIAAQKPTLPNAVKPAPKSAPSIPEQKTCNCTIF